jgi:hypothetical protein
MTPRVRFHGTNVTVGRTGVAPLCPASILGDDLPFSVKVPSATSCLRLRRGDAAPGVAVLRPTTAPRLDARE